MEHALYVVWMAKQAWPFMFDNRQINITTALFAAVAVAVVFNFPFRRSRFQRRHMLVFAPLIVTILILVWGSIMRHDDYQTLAPTWPYYTLNSLLAAQMLIGIGSVWAMKGYRWFALAVVLLEAWFGWWCTFIAAMSVTGDWL
jgi:FlaA1/EpsC-like NDP-sugar epimerase